MAGRIGRQVWVIIQLLFIGAFCIPAVSGLSDPANLSSIRWGPYLTNMTTDSVTITWWTDEASRGMIWYEDIQRHSPGSFEWYVTEDQDSLRHRFMLGNLSPNQTYAYSISGSTKEYSFRTFPANGSITFVVYGDTRDQLPFYTQNERHGIVSDRIAQEDNILFVINTGDLVQSGNDPEDWDRFFAAAGNLLPNVTYYPVLGNHEENSSLYYDIFGFPPVYSLTCGDVKVAILDDNLGATPTIDEQAEWLDQEFADWDGWKFVAFHYPIYSSQEGRNHVREDLKGAWEPVLIKNDIVAVFTGHVHAYEHYEEEGIHHFVLATGGAPPYQLSPDKPRGHVMSVENTLGYAVATVDPEQGLAVIRYVEVARVEDRDVILHEKDKVLENVIIQSPYSRRPLLWFLVPESYEFSRMPDYFNA
jgi:hypothetical protein